MRMRNLGGLARAGETDADREQPEARLRQALTAAGLDIGHKQGGLPEPATSEDQLAWRAGGLADARKMRDAIIIVTALLGRLDELSPDETDAGVFDEIACLFGDMADFAAFGADAVRRASGRTGGRSALAVTT